MKNLKDIIIDLREIYQNDKEKYSYGNLLKQMEENGDFLSKSTLSRLFGNDWEKYSFDYQNTILPITRVMLGLDEDDDENDWSTETTKLALKFKLESETASKREKEKYHERLAEETAKYQKSLDFAMRQIELKDKRIDQLMDANDRLSITNDRLINQLMDCPLKKDCDEG